MIATTTHPIDDTRPSVYELMLHGSPKRPHHVDTQLTDRSQVLIHTPTGTHLTDYNSPLTDIDPRAPDRERVRVGWREGQRKIYRRHIEDPSMFDGISTFWGRFKRA